MRRSVILVSLILVVAAVSLRAQGVNINETQTVITPSSLFTVGNGEGFQVNSSGNVIKVNGISYSWPSGQGTADTFLKNDGSGNLSWAQSLTNGASMTSDGGFAIQLYNGSGAAIPKGTVVQIKPSGSATDQIIPAVTSGDLMPIGIAAMDIPNNSSGPVTIAGIAVVLTEGTVTMGQMGYPGASVAGKLVATSSPNNSGNHWGECGHFLTASSGTPATAKIILHFN